MMEGIKAIRRMHVHVIEETGFTCAEEILYPEIIDTCRIFSPTAPSAPVP